MSDAPPPVPEPPALAPAGPDPNLAAVERAGIDGAHAQWLVTVARAVPSRLDAVVPRWRRHGDPVVSLAAVFGLAVGALARQYPQTREILHSVAEAHPCWETLPAGRRLEVLATLAADPLLVLDWLEDTLPGLDRERAAQLTA